MRKIFKAMELIATSRIGKARARVAASLPYANAITRAVSAVASQSEIDHPLTTEPEQIRRAAVLVITSDRGLAGSYSAGVLKQAEGLNELLHAEGKEVKTYLVGRKAQAYFEFRNREYTRVWTTHRRSPLPVKSARRCSRNSPPTMKRAAWTKSTWCTPASSPWLPRSPRSSACFRWK
jgi:F-type H+-transporting ATPase subunit gamma